MGVDTTFESPRSAEPARPTTALLLGLMSSLFVLLTLNLVVFDDLRVDSSAGVIETFTKPPHLASLLAVLLAVALVVGKHPSALRVAAVVAWLEIAGFTILHLILVEAGPVKPYWGEAMGDALQWVGLLSVLAVSAAIVRATRRSTMT